MTALLERNGRNSKISNATLASAPTNRQPINAIRVMLSSNTRLARQFKSHGDCEIRTFAEDRARQSHRGIRTGGGSSPQRRGFDDGGQAVNSRALPISAISVQESVLTFSIARIGGTYSASQATRGATVKRAHLRHESLKSRFSASGVKKPPRRRDELESAELQLIAVRAAFRLPNRALP